MLSFQCWLPEHRSGHIAALLTQGKLYMKAEGMRPGQVQCGLGFPDSCRELLPLQNLVKDVAQAFGVSEGDIMKIKSTIHEDNEPCVKLANMELPRITNRSKHIAIRYHWFREHLGIDWDIVSISTHDQLADIFTKSLPLATFEKLRRIFMGW